MSSLYLCKLVMRNKDIYICKQNGDSGVWGGGNSMPQALVNKI